MGGRRLAVGSAREHGPGGRHRRILLRDGRRKSACWGLARPAGVATEPACAEAANQGLIAAAAAQDRRSLPTPETRSLKWRQRDEPKATGHLPTPDPRPGPPITPFHTCSAFTPVVAVGAGEAGCAEPGSALTAACPTEAVPACTMSSSATIRTLLFSMSLMLASFTRTRACSLSSEPWRLPTCGVGGVGRGRREQGGWTSARRARGVSKEGAAGAAPCACSAGPRQASLEHADILSGGVCQPLGPDPGWRAGPPGRSGCQGCSPCRRRTGI